VDGVSDQHVSQKAEAPHAEADKGRGRVTAQRASAWAGAGIRLFILLSGKKFLWFKETAREIDAAQPSDAFDRVVEEMARRYPAIQRTQKELVTEIKGKETMTRSEELLGCAVFEQWADLPRDVQEVLFEAAVAHEPDVRERLATDLHNRHPRTAHPPRPTKVV
jgi:hypothetical protein